MVIAERSVYIVVSCDTDPDRPGFLNGTPSDGLTWRGMTEGIPALKDLLHGVTDSRGREQLTTMKTLRSAITTDYRGLSRKR